MNNILDIQYTNKFKKQYQKISKQKDFNKEEFEYVVFMLANNQILPKKYKNHLLFPKSYRHMGISYTARLIIGIQKKQ